MGFMDYDSQVPLVRLKGFPDRPFFANNNSRVYDPKIIDTAVGMVDKVLPQKFGNHGMHYYSFIRRERFLNCILRQYGTTGMLPTKEQLEVMLENVRAYSYADREQAVHKKADKAPSGQRASSASEDGVSLWTIYCVLVIIMAVVRAIKNT